MTKSAENIVELYVKSSCASSRKAHTWVNIHNPNYKKIELHKEGVTIEFIKKVLRLSGNGISSILVDGTLTEEEELTTPMNEIYERIIKNPKLLKTPILIQGKKIHIGYSEEEIRKFLPREVRKQERKRIYAAI